MSSPWNCIFWLTSNRIQNRRDSSNRYKGFFVHYNSNKLNYYNTGFSITNLFHFINDLAINISLSKIAYPFFAESLFIVQDFELYRIYNKVVHNCTTKTFDLRWPNIDRQKFFAASLLWNLSIRHTHLFNFLYFVLFLIIFGIKPFVKQCKWLHL